MTTTRDRPTASAAGEAPLTEELSALRAELREIRSLKADLAEVLGELRGRSKSHYSVAEVARLVDRSEYRVREWIREGLLAAVRVEGTRPRGRMLVPREELRRLVRSGRAAALPADLADDITAA